MPGPSADDTGDTGDTAAGAELAAVLRPSLLRITRLIRQQRADISITLTLLAAMMTLDRRGPLSPGELAACERVQPPSMTKILTKLEDAGLVSRSAHASDRRQAVVTLTDAGRELIAQERTARTAWLATRLELLEPHERDILLRAVPVLDRLATL